MIRFCDREVGFVEYDSLNRKELEEYVILDQDMWDEAREYFAYRNGFSKNNFLLPVFNKDGQLICFAYEDDDANREIRQLRELSEMDGALQFPDIYPEYKCVKIHEFNELAYFFAKYLEKQNITVQVEGAMWQEFFTGEECLVPDYECLNIYAEGTWEKKRNWRENLLRSVSVEFECVDKIYEANIKNGFIKDAKGDWADLLKYLKCEREIILYGTTREAQDAYDFFVKNGIDICCFVDTETEEKKHRIFGKEIVSELQARRRYPKAVCVDCVAKNSSWGLGNVDYYDYIGYKRNERFILLRDYVDVPEDNLLSALQNINVALLGDTYLCSCLYGYLKQKKVSVMGYLPVMPEDIQMWELPEIGVTDIDKDVMCLLVDPLYNRYENGKRRVKEKKKQFIEWLEENHIDNYSVYFSDMSSFINIEQERNVKYTKEWLMPKRIVLGSIEPLSGNVFFRGLLDNHSDIVMMHYSELNNNLFWICVCLSMVETDKILPLLYEMIEDSGNSFYNLKAFDEKMKQLLSKGNKFTSEDLFVMIHIACMNMCGRNIEDADISNMIIYWEPHFVQRFVLEDCVKWLGTKEMPCDIINVVRNVCTQRGSMLKTGIMAGAENIWSLYARILRCPIIEKKTYKHSNRLTVKFEDLKCNSKETLSKICKSWNLMWSDTLMTTTRYGEKEFWNNGENQISDFDLRPVYDTYEKFFSEYDRMRLLLILAPWEISYGYPYVEVACFTKKELQEMFLKEFRFEKLSGIKWCKDELDDRLALQTAIRCELQKTRMLEFYRNGNTKII